MGPGSLVVLCRQLTVPDIRELEAAGYTPPEVGKTIYEVKEGPYLTVFEGISILAVKFVETGHTEWAAYLFLEIDEPKVIDLETLVKVQ